MGVQFTHRGRPYVVVPKPGTTSVERVHRMMCRKPVVLWRRWWLWWAAWRALSAVSRALPPG